MENSSTPAAKSKISWRSTSMSCAICISKKTMISASAANSSFLAPICFTKFRPRAASPPAPSYSIASLPLENASAREKSGIAAVPVASSDFVVTCENFRDAQPHLEQTRQRGRAVLLPLLEDGIVPVVTGFIGATPDGRITTLGRNSSDFSGAIIAHVVDAEELVIWTDVDGIYTANPNESAEARLLHELSYDEAHALAANGAKVLHAKVLPLAAETEMVVWVRNTFNPQARGTRIGPVQQEELA